MTISRVCATLLSAAALAALVSGCSKEPEAPTPATQADAVKARLNDPSVSEYEKNQIRTHMNVDGQGAPASGTPSTGATTSSAPPAPEGGKSTAPASGGGSPNAGSGSGK